MSRKEERFGNARNTNGFDKRPDDAKKGGRKPSIRKALSQTLSCDGSLFIPLNEVIDLDTQIENEDGKIIKGIRIKVATDMDAAIQLNKWIMSSNGRISLQAIQIAIDQIDGKPKHELEIKTLPDLGIVTKTILKNDK